MCQNLAGELLERERAAARERQGERNDLKHNIPERIQEPENPKHARGYSHARDTVPAGTVLGDLLSWQGEYPIKLSALGED